MIDSSILARQCAPEAPDVAPSVRISDVWAQAYEAVARSAARDALVDRWARERYRDRVEWREKYGVNSAVHEMMTCGLRQGDFILRVHDGARAWRLPEAAFDGWRGDMDLEMTWTSGRLWPFEAADGFRAIADLDLPLLITQAEADAFQAKVARHIGEVESLPPDEAPQYDEGEVAAWSTACMAKRYWPVREALLWVASRDPSEMAKLHLGSVWGSSERLGMAGAVRAKAEVDGQAQWRRIVEADPEARLMAALAAGHVRAHGFFEGQGPMREIEAVQWTRLAFGILPEAQRDRSDAFNSAACVTGQIHGVRWSSHWTAIAIDREDLLRALPPVALNPDAAMAELTVSGSGPDDNEASAAQSATWVGALMVQARWPTPVVLAWIAFRRADVLAKLFGPQAYWHDLLSARQDIRLDLLLAAIENEGDAHDADPRAALERAVQREGLLAADMAPGSHATHRAEQLIGHEFWREDVLALFPELADLAMVNGDATRDDSDAAVDATIRRLSDNRGSPIPRNVGAIMVQELHPSRTRAFILQRIKQIYPSVTPGPKGPRKRADKYVAPA